MRTLPSVFNRLDRSQFCSGWWQMARPKRFELLTPRFVVWCSIQLSYGRVFRWHFGAQGPPMPHASGKRFQDVAKERFSYPLRPELARSGNARRGGNYRSFPAHRGMTIRPYARARSLRMLSNSTGRSGITIRKVAPMVPSTRWISPPWAWTSSAAIASPSPLPPGRPEVWKASNR